MTEDPSHSEDERRPQHRLQFSLATLLFLAIPVGLLAGAWSTLTNSDPGDPLHWFGLVLVAAAPMALAILTSLVQRLRR